MPVAYIASRNSLLHLETEGGVTLCQRRQVAGARSLVSPMRALDKFEAFAWQKEQRRRCFSLARWQSP